MRERANNSKKRKTTLKQNIISLLVLGWAVPVIIMTALLATYVEDKSSEQMEQTVASSVDKAVEIFNLELHACETSSKNASYYSDIRDAYLNYCATSNSRYFTSEVNKFIRSEYKYNGIVKTAVLYFPRKDMYYHTYNNSAGATYKNVSYYLKNVCENVNEISKDISTDTVLYTQNGHNYMVRNLMLSSFEPYGVLALEVNDESLRNGFWSIWGYKTGVILLDGEYMMGNSQLLKRKHMDEVINSEKEERTTFHHYMNASYATVTWTEYGKNITAIIELDKAVINSKMYATWLIFGLIIVVMIPLTAIIFRFFRRNVTEPIDVMMKAYDEVANKNYGYQIMNPNTTREFYYMQKSFNDMSLQIKEQFERIYKEEIALRDAKIMALQSQINPHFLNNTFEIINWEARLKGNIKVSKMIEALSTMIEATMNRKGERMHTMAEELSYVDAYAYIISERFGDNFSYEKEIDESLLSVRVPKLIVQPIVENAVEHGAGESHRKNIRLSLYEKGEYVYIDITNDGIMSDQDRQKVERILKETIDPEKESSLSLGIRNVNNRLKLIYGEDCGLFMENRKEGYTVSTIIIKKRQALEQ